jgi:hypothetical protein
MKSTKNKIVSCDSLHLDGQPVNFSCFDNLYVTSEKLLLNSLYYTLVDNIQIKLYNNIYVNFNRNLMTQLKNEGYRS